MCAIIFSCIFFYGAVIYAVDGWALWRGEPRELMRKIVQEHQALLLESVSLSKGEYFKRENAADRRKIPAFRIKDIRSIDGRSDDGSVAFYFPWTSSIIEGSIKLEYRPDNTFPEPYYGYDWLLVSHTEDTWRWEGGGTNGKGYVAIECFAENWFYVEEYLPT